MNQQIQNLKGFRDFLPVEAAKRKWLRDRLAQICEQWGFAPLETPTLEPLELFTGQIGEDEKLFFKFKFHRDRIEEPAVKGVVSDALKQVFGATIVIESIVNEVLNISETLEVSFDNDSTDEVAEQIIRENQATEKVEKVESGDGGGDMLDSLLKTFGGKVVG